MSADRPRGGAYIRSLLGAMSGLTEAQKEAVFAVIRSLVAAAPDLTEARKDELRRILEPPSSRAEARRRTPQ